MKSPRGRDASASWANRQSVAMNAPSVMLEVDGNQRSSRTSACCTTTPQALAATSRDTRRSPLLPRSAGRFLRAQDHAQKTCSRTYCDLAVCSDPTERAMPYRPEHRQTTRSRIIRSARLLFNRHGFDGASIDDIMRHAGLTRGGFYSYFRTKSDLYAEAVALALAEPPSRRWKGISVDFGAVDAARQVIRGYLSRQHFEDIDGSCPLVALPSDVSRSKPIVKRTYEMVFKAMVDLF